MSARLAVIGAPGAGKSAVARELGRRWDCRVLDSDEEYALRHGHSVAEAVIDDEAGFRLAEADIVVASLQEVGGVVAVGSGAVDAPGVAAALRSVPVVWLEVGLVDAARRTGLSGARPLSLGNVRGQLHDMLVERAKVYGPLADLTVATDGREVAAVCDQIVEWEGSA